MANRPRIRLNNVDNEKILKRLAMDACVDVAEKIQDLTGAPEDYEIEEYVGQSRARVTIRTIDEWPARTREARDHNLIRALAEYSANAPANPNRLIQYTSARGVVSYRTQAEIDNYTRNRRA